MHSPAPDSPLIIPRADHPISRAHISPNALKVLERLRDAGYAGLLVGGCVRDLMLGREPKDFDVVTDARPEDIKALFRNARLIGRRFRLAHVHFGREIIEVATFRAEAVEGEGLESDESGRLLSDNVFGNQEQDARRRDFTVNALYYDIRDRSVIDYVGGVPDLRQGILRVIGDPLRRYREDPVRMLRVVRFAAKLGLRLEPGTEAPIRELAPLLLQVPPARLFEEVLKLFHGGYALETYELLRHYDLFRFLFPLTEDSLAREQEHFPRMLLPLALENTDARVNEDKPVNPAFLFAALLWEPLQLEVERRRLAGEKEWSLHEAAQEQVLREQARRIVLPRRFSAPMREIWSMQARFARRGGKQAQRLLEHKRFRAAYDFLLLRARAGEESQELADWWTQYQEVAPEQRAIMAQTQTQSRSENQSQNQAPPAPGRGRRRRRRRAKANVPA